MQRKGGRCFPWTSGRRPFFPPISDAARYTLREEGGFPYSRPNQLRAHTELKRVRGRCLPGGHCSGDGWPEKRQSTEPV